jgi:hypothetical protein
MKWIWTSRYSETDEPDEYGRWARIGYLEHRSGEPHQNKEIGWVRMIPETKEFVGYVAIGNHGNRMGGNFKTLQEAKDFIESKVKAFIFDYQLDEELVKLNSLFMQFLKDTDTNGDWGDWLDGNGYDEDEIYELTSKYLG